MHKLKPFVEGDEDNPESKEGEDEEDGEVGEDTMIGVDADDRQAEVAVVVGKLHVKDTSLDCELSTICLWHIYQHVSSCVY